jgi:hypothetical protein
MDEMDVARTIRTGRLALKKPLLVMHFRMLFQALLSCLPFIVLCLFASELLQSNTNKHAIFYSLLTTSYAACYLMVWKQYSPTVLTGVSLDKFQQALLPVLNEYEFKVDRNNARYLHAICTANRACISDNFYAVYTKQSVLLFCVCELPFPFSVMKPKAVINSILTECNDG